MRALEKRTGAKLTRLTFELSPEEKREIQFRARLLRISVSEYVRRVAHAYAAQQDQPAAK